MFVLIVQSPRGCHGFVRSYDPEKNDGYGALCCTDNEDYALKFENYDHANWFVNQSPRCRPLYEDGTPNRPLRNYAIEYVRYPLQMSIAEKIAKYAQVESISPQ